MRILVLLVVLSGWLATVPPARADRLVGQEELAHIAALLSRESCEPRCESAEWQVEGVDFPAGYTPPAGSSERLYLVTAAPRQCGVGRCISAYVLRDATHFVVLKEGWNLGVVERITAREIARPGARGNLLRTVPRAAWHHEIVPGSTLDAFRHGTFPSLGQRTHVGVDLVAPCGTPVRAWEAGEIVDVIVREEEANRVSAQGERVGIGYMILLRHGDMPDGRPLHSIYLHLQGPPPKRSGRVERGEVIGAVGNTGAVVAEQGSDGCHLHFELRHFRSRFHPGWRNIYGKGDQRRSTEFLNDWSDPEVLQARGVPPAVTARAETCLAQPTPECLISAALALVETAEADQRPELYTTIADAQVKAGAAHEANRTMTAALAAARALPAAPDPLQGESSRDLALLTVGQVQARHGLIDAALATSREIGNPSIAGSLLLAVVEAQARQGLIPEAQANALRFADGSGRGRALVHVASAHARAGRMAEALATAESIHAREPSARASAWTRIAEEQVKLGQQAGATFDRSRAIVLGMASDGAKIQGLVEIAASLWRAGLHHSSASMFAEALSAARLRSEPAQPETVIFYFDRNSRSQALSWIVSAYLEAGMLADATAIADEIAERNFARRLAVRDVVTAYAEAGRIAEAQAAAALLPQNARTLSLPPIAGALARAGRTVEAVETIRQLPQAATSERVAALTAVGLALRHSPHRSTTVAVQHPQSAEMRMGETGSTASSGTTVPTSSPIAAPGLASSPEANALFVRASMLARQGDAASGSEQVRLYREALVLFDRIVSEHPSTTLARRIAGGERLGQVDVAELRRVVRQDAAIRALLQASQQHVADFRRRFPQTYDAIWAHASLSEVVRTAAVLALAKTVELADSPELGRLAFSALQVNGRSLATWALNNPETAVRMSAARVVSEWTEGLLVGIAASVIADALFQVPPMAALPSGWQAPLRSLIEATIAEFASVLRAGTNPAAAVGPLVNRALDVVRIARASGSLARTQDTALAAMAVNLATAVELAQSYPSDRSRDIAAQALRQAQADVPSIVGHDDANAVRRIVDLTHQALVTQRRGEAAAARALVQQILQIGRASGNITPFSAILRPVDWLTAVARGGRDAPERAAEIMIAFTPLSSLTTAGGVGQDRSTGASSPVRMPDTGVGSAAARTSGSGYPVAVGQSFRDCPECPEMVVIPPGRFLMGSPDSEEGRNANESPQREVSVHVPLAVGRHPITVAQYRTFVQATGRSEGQPCRVWNGRWWEEQQGMSWRSPGFAQEDDHPVVCVSWEDAKAYAEWLSNRTGQRYRLLTEAEWEFAARAGTATRWWWGEIETEQCHYANAADQTTLATVPGGAPWRAATAPCTDGFAYTAPVGRFLANSFGLHDMGGNVFQWVEDCYRDSYEAAPADASLAVTTGDCERRVLRGGSWVALPRGVRSANRLNTYPRSRLSMFGFRVARTP